MVVNKIKNVALVGLLCFSWASCIREEPAPVTQQSDVTLVPVAFSFEVNALEDGTPETKTLMEPDNGISANNQIDNFVVLQFDGVSPAAFPVGEQQYFDHYPLNPGETITLAASDVPNTVLVLANTFGPVSITSRTTLARFMEQAYSTISGLSGMFTTKNGDEYIRMSGSAYVSSISAGTPVTVTLKRNIAKIILKVRNTSSGADAVSLSHVHLQDINTKYYYLANIAPELTAANPSIVFSDPYSESNPQRMDHTLLSFPAEKNPGQADAGQWEQYEFWVPANLRGVTSSTQQYCKGNGAPDGATRICLHGSYVDTGYTPARNTLINYTYYLGGNLENDFNLRPNHKYTYEITIPSKGDAEFDYRIDDTKEVTFKKDANCYILHPPVVEGQTRSYRIPVRRAAVFWNPSSSSGVYEAYNFTGYSAHKIESNTNWTARVLWSDFNMSSYTGDNAFLQESTGRGYDPDNHAQAYITVRVTAGMKGNVVVGLDVGGDNLWSWHFWITDYDPDRHVAVSSGQYRYGVGHGEVHRYNSPIWSTAADDTHIGYASGFIMDRNLGAMGIKNTGEQSGGLYYQYGRKDPFLDRSDFYREGTIYEPVLTSGGTSISDRVVTYAYNAADESKNVRFTVKNPMVFIRGGSKWTSDDDDLASGAAAGYTNYYWNDRKFWLHTDSGSQNILEMKKSIYDPCPAGWKLPVPEIYNNFVRQVGSELTYTVDASYAGLYYYPEGYENAATTGRIYYPLTGYREYTSGNLMYVDVLGQIWMATFKNTTIAYRFSYGNNALIINREWYKPEANTVRCIREEPYLPGTL